MGLTKKELREAQSLVELLQSWGWNYRRCIRAEIIKELEESVRERENKESIPKPPGLSPRERAMAEKYRKRY